MEAEQKIEFGDEVRCQATGIVGIVISRTECLHGEDQIGIQPPSKDGEKAPDGVGIDESYLLIVTKQKASIQPKNGIQEATFGLGDEVVDDITDFKGVVTSITTFANGCKQARVRAKMTEKGFTNAESFNVARWKKVEPVKPKSKEREPSRKSGGPNTRLERRSI